MTPRPMDVHQLITVHLLKDSRIAPEFYRMNKAAMNNCAQKQQFPTHLGIYSNDIVMVRVLSVVLKETAELVFQSACVIVSFR